MGARFALFCLFLLAAVPALFSGLERRDFRPASLPGFGDRQNSWAWSMLWWNGNLYVGTNRAYGCVTSWALQKATGSPIFPYPPNNPDLECTANPADLPLQAEIWRFSPVSLTWTRVYQSPNDVPNPDNPGKFVPREIGFRSMGTFTGADNVERLYVGGVNSQSMWTGKVPPPRILYTTDGLSFTPIPQDAGTFMGELTDGSIRSLTSFQGRLYAINGTVQGAGKVIASTTPELGNDSWQVVTAPTFGAFELEVFNNFLYAGIQDPQGGYAIQKTDASGTPPFAFQTIVPAGGYLPDPSSSILSMAVFGGRLYAGSAAFAIPAPPVELLRIDADDNWSLLVGTPRTTPLGPKNPLSGLGDGFENGFNDHIWRMAAHEDSLYLGTYDSTESYASLPGVEPLVANTRGTDLFRTQDGWYFTSITGNGFNDKFNFGIRSLVSTPIGVFLGTANSAYGIEIWRGFPSNPPPLPPARRLELEVTSTQNVLTWEPSPTAVRYQVWRIPLETVTLYPTVLGNPTVPKPPVLLGFSFSTTFAEPSPGTQAPCMYFVSAVDSAGQVSEVSNLVRYPLHTPPVSFASLTQTANGLNSRNLYLNQAAYNQALTAIQTASTQAAANDLAGSLATLAALRTSIETGQILQPIYVNDLAIPVLKMQRRLGLAASGSVQRSALAR